MLNKPHRLASGVPPVGYVLGNNFFNENNPKAKPIIGAARKLPETYDFASEGHVGIYDVLKRAIERAEQFIYLEDQYLVDDLDMDKLKSMLNLLATKVAKPSFKKLIILCTRMDDINNEMQQCAWPHRKAFVEPLLAKGNDKVVVCQYRRRDAVGAPGRDEKGLFYIHSKTGSSTTSTWSPAPRTAIDAGIHTIVN